ncbi:hypothetical protein [Burkholderia pseudomallei]|uniref:hypothetical protein n=1 Tax=Burkholderia pseudomallei TaxID=28450 RepID=UPI001F506A8E|nr:hypothetical protein [Burkholderia pseudomallei]
MKPSRWFAVAAFSFLTGGVARFSGEGGGAKAKAAAVAVATAAGRAARLSPTLGGARGDVRQTAFADRPIGRSKTDTQLGHNVRVTLERRRT